MGFLLLNIFFLRLRHEIYYTQQEAGWDVYFKTGGHGHRVQPPYRILHDSRYIPDFGTGEIYFPKQEKRFVMIYAVFFSICRNP